MATVSKVRWTDRRTDLRQHYRYLGAKVSQDHKRKTEGLETANSQANNLSSDPRNLPSWISSSREADQRAEFFRGVSLAYYLSKDYSSARESIECLQIYEPSLALDTFLLLAECDMYLDNGFKNIRTFRDRLLESPEFDCEDIVRWSDALRTDGRLIASIVLLNTAKDKFKEGGKSTEQYLAMVGECAFITGIAGHRMTRIDRKSFEIAVKYVYEILLTSTCISLRYYEDSDARTVAEARCFHGMAICLHGFGKTEESKLLMEWARERISEMKMDSLYAFEAYYAVQSYLTLLYWECSQARKAVSSADELIAALNEKGVADTDFEEKRNTMKKKFEAQIKGMFKHKKNKLSK